MMDFNRKEHSAAETQPKFDDLLAEDAKGANRGE